jgi:cell division transport system ATP-binding protein
MNSTDQIIYAKGLNIFREQQPVLADIDLSIQKGDFCYLLGSTGSGKSSLLKTLYGALPVHSGTLFVTGEDLSEMSSSGLPSFRRKLGMIFQDFRLLEDRTVYQNLDLILRATDWRKKEERRERITQILEWVHLPDKTDRFPHQLSGGEKQRVAIARALLNEPQLVIGDEPTGNLDPATSDEILYLLRRMNKEMGAAVLLATHDYRLLDKFPGRILRVEGGQIEETVL